MPNKQLADKVIDGMPNGDGRFMGINLREFSKKQLIKIMCAEHNDFVSQIRGLRLDLYAMNEKRHVKAPENGLIPSMLGEKG